MPISGQSTELEIHTEHHETPTEGRIFLAVIDGTEEFEPAFEYACRRAKTTGGHVSLLYVIPPVEFEHFMFVGDAIREDSRKEAEAVLLKYADRVFELCEKMPIINVREGERSDELLKFLEEETVHVLILGASTGKNGPGPLISSLMSKDLRQLNVPLAIIPDNMKPEKIEAITEQ